MSKTPRRVLFPILRKTPNNVPFWWPFGDLREDQIRKQLRQETLLLQKADRRPSTF